MGEPQNGWFLRENLINMDDNYPYFRKPPFLSRNKLVDFNFSGTKGFDHKPC